MRSSNALKPNLAMVTLLALMSALPVRADPPCYVCDEVVELDTKLASCFQRDFDKILATAKNSPTSSAEVNFSACGASDKEVRGIDQMPSLAPLGQKRTDPAKVTLRSVYILNTASIVCLRRLIDTQRDKLDPKRSFDLQAECAP